jgi:DNA (cytosine-5)-methyltransferase 1
MSELLCGSLFSGVGGMDIGFAWAGWRHAFFAEIEPFGRAVLAERFPGVPIYSDVRDVPECGSGIPWGEPRERVDADGRLRRSDAEGNGPADGDSESHERPDSVRGARLDVLTFGSPCQDLSVAGKRRGLDGDRSGLFWEAMRIAGDGPLRPRALLMENVEGLLSSNGGRDFALILDAMAERGYRWSYRVLDSQHFAVAQRRRRVFVVAIADDDPRAERIGEVLALAEGGGGDSPTREPSWPDVAARVGAGAPSGGGDDGAMTHTHTPDRSGSYREVGEGQRRTGRRRVSEPRHPGRVVGPLYPWDERERERGAS